MEANGYVLPILSSMECTLLTRGVVQIFCAVVYCLFAAGVVFGYAAIKPVLIDEGVYREKCTKQELKDDVIVCYEQELR